MATVKASAATTSITDVVMVSQVRPAESVHVHTDKSVTYWYHGPFITEGPWDASGMERARAHFEKYRESGWWERRTAVTTTIIERL